MKTDTKAAPTLTGYCPSCSHKTTHTRITFRGHNWLYECDRCSGSAYRAQIKAQTARMSVKYVSFRCIAFTGDRTRNHTMACYDDGSVHVYDYVGGYYTACHALTAEDCTAIRAKAGF